ncbi:MAG TPA: hypothetical protein VNG51_11725 [Ktedonobacteraceae bacterium]|nr:hypothetical protein [Ktedonobacteraceae bacterium]
MPFALFNDILEFDERPLFSAGEHARERMRRSSYLEKKSLRQIEWGAG